MFESMEKLKNMKETLTYLKRDIEIYKTMAFHFMIIDEAQRFPEIFSYLQVLVDEQNFAETEKKKFIVTGSAIVGLLACPV